MAAFEFKALDQRGRLKTGVLEGDTSRHIRQQLREQGLTPLEVREVSEQRRATGAGPLLRGRASLSPLDLAMVTRQLATLLRAGTVLEEALAAVAEQAEKRQVQRVLLAVRSRVLEGHDLASALAAFPGTFSELYRATVAAGEEAGRLDLVLERLADHTEFRQQLRQKIILALIYPVLLAVVALLVVAGLLTYVVPQITRVFANLGQELPLLTRLLMATSGLARHYGPFLLAMLAMAVVAFRLLLRRPGFRLASHRLLLSLPFIGRLSRTLNAARFARALSILTASGVPVLEGLAIAGQVIGNQAMREAVAGAAAKVREGSSLSQTLRASGCFPPLTLHLIASGEASSSLDTMLDKAAAAHERQLETSVAALMGIFEPVMILVMGGLVLIIVLAILLPIFDLNQLVQ